MNNDKEDYVAFAILALIAIGILSFVGAIYYGIYHLLDKLIDKL